MISTSLRVLGGWFMAIAIGLPSLSSGAEETRPYPARPMLWKMEGNGLTKPVYLFGAIPVPGGPASVAHPLVEKAFEESPVFLIEVGGDEVSQKKLRDKLVRKDGITLNDALGTDLSKRLDDEMKKVMPGWGIRFVQECDGWFVSYLVPYMAVFGGQHDETLEKKLWNRAVALGKKPSGFAPDKLIGEPFISLSESEQNKLVRQMLDSAEKQRETGKNQIRLLTEAYLSGDLANYLVVFDSNVKFDDEFTDAALKAKIDRGRTENYKGLTEAFISKIQSDPGRGYFALFDLDFLVLPGGVRARLEKEGYTITRVAEEPAKAAE